MQSELQMPVPTHVPAPPANSSPRARGSAGTRVARSLAVPGTCMRLAQRINVDHQATEV